MPVRRHQLGRVDRTEGHHPSAVTTIEDSTFIFSPMPNTRIRDGVGHAALFKQMGAGHVVMRNDIVCYQETPIGASRVTKRTTWPGTSRP